jgi:excisionase family DNA binding protein
MKQTQHPPISYSIKEAMAVSSLGRTRLYDLINDGSLKVTRIGGRTLVNAQSLRELLTPQ